MDHKESQNLMFSMVRDKSVLKQDIFNNIILNFKVLKQVLKEVGDDLKDRIGEVDDRVVKIKLKEVAKQLKNSLTNKNKIDEKKILNILRLSDLVNEVRNARK